MKTFRTDLFTLAHKALRRMMYETGISLERANFADFQQKKVVLKDLDRTLLFLEEHLQLEDRFVDPLLAQLSPGLDSELGAQHIEHIKATQRMRDLRQELSQSGGDSALALGVRLCKTFNVMIAAQSEHMNREERMANPVLWNALNDEELSKIQEDIQAAISPQRSAEWLEAIFTTANHQEVVAILERKRRSVPPAQLEAVRSLAQKSLGDRWAEVDLSLTA